jgi:hypothetical protein
VDLIVSPTIVTLNPQLGAAVPALKAGDIIEAQVLALLGQDIAKLAIGNTVLEVQTKVPLTPGTTVRLAVKNTPEGIRLSIVGNPISAPTPASSPSPGTAPASAVAAGRASPASPASTNEGLIAQAATPGVTTAAGGTPAAAVPATTVEVSPTAAGTQRAPTPANGAPDAAPAPQEPAIAPALTMAVQTSAARQNGLAPLFADAAVAAVSPALPQPVREAVGKLLALQPALAETVSAHDVRQALDRSGLFLEARLSAAASADTAAPDGHKAASGGAAAAPSALNDFPIDEVAANDLKGALIVLRNVIRIWLGAQTPEGGAPKSPLPQLSNTAPIVPGPDKAADPRALGTPTAAGPPPPPYRGAPTVAQPVAAPSVTPDMAPRAIAKVLLTEADAAIARQTLLQAASLPDRIDPGARADPSGPRWNFEVPFATPQGTAVAQFEIARDGRRASTESSKPVWCARFSFDVEPIGPVHAQIALIGARAAVTLWAERADTSTRLRDQAGELSDALRAAELDPSDVLVRFGAPPRPREAAPSGRFLDRAS